MEVMDPETMAFHFAVSKPDKAVAAVLEDVHLRAVHHLTFRAFLCLAQGI